MHSIGGAERLITDLVLGLAGEGISVDLLTGFCNKIWRDQIFARAKNDKVLIQEVGWKASGNIRFWFNVNGFVKSLVKNINRKTDAIITSGFPSNLISSQLLQDPHIKTIHYLHEAPIVLHDSEGIESLPFILKNFYMLTTLLTL